MTYIQEYDGKQEGNIEPIKEYENNNDDIKTKEDLEDENEEYLKEKIVLSLDEISSLKKENEELKKKSHDGDHNLNKTRKEVDLFKLQVQERDGELTKLKEELHQNKKMHNEEVISTTHQLDKAKKREETLSRHLGKIHEDLDKLERKIGQ